ncbi:tRNA 2-thiocytidine(32) synthetase TtcA [bacterium]|nr:tRNA 2-thiocytidine(32) synthetase TtcA [candidate division CSSED10-310 bacterium]
MTRSRTAIENRIYRRTGTAIRDYDLIHANDRILVAVSGGVDSWTLLHVLQHFRSVSPIPFELVPVTINPGFPEFQTDVIETGFRRLAPDLPWRIVSSSIDHTIRTRNTPGKYPCAFCARLRRGALYRVATELGCNRIALGHHADDAVETALISALSEGNLVSLPPRLHVTNRSIIVIRPLIRIWKTEILEYAASLCFPITDCGHQAESGNMRNYVRDLLQQIDQERPGARYNLLAALHHINPTHFLDTRWL